MARFQKANAGQFILNDWLGQRNNEATIQEVLSVLLPVQEMSNFQRRIFESGGKLLLSLGEKGKFELIVPDDETWLILWVRLTQADSAAKVTRLEIQPKDPARPAIFVSRRNVLNSLNTPLYPSIAVVSPNSGFFDARSGPPYEAYPGDTVIVIDETPTAAAGPITWEPSLRYEVLPPPLIQAVNNDFTLAVA